MEDLAEIATRDPLSTSCTEKNYSSQLATIHFTPDPAESSSDLQNPSGPHWPTISSQTTSGSGLYSSSTAKSAFIWSNFGTHSGESKPFISSDDLRARSEAFHDYTELPSIHVQCPSDESQDLTVTDVVEESQSIAQENMTTLATGSGDARRGVVSPRPKGRENAKNTICRNIGIYGHCRWEKEGCAFNHDVNGASKTSTSSASSSYTGADNSKKSLNVESPAFKPLQPAVNGQQKDARSTAISPKSADAAPFTPKTNVPSSLPSQPSSGSSEFFVSSERSALQDQLSPQAVALQPGISQSSWSSAQSTFAEFVPQTEYANQVLQQSDSHTAASSMLGYADPFGGVPNSHAAASINPYAQDATALAGATYYQSASSTFAQPAQYHNYAPVGPHQENLLAYQKTAHDFFMPDKLREDLQKKAETTLQVLPTSTLPTIDHFHSLVPLDTSGQRSSATFGYVTWLYKAQSSKDGKYYALRRLEGFRLTSEKAIHAARAWKQIDNGGVVNVHEAFTTREFGDSSLIFVTDYHPNSKTLAEAHLQGPSMSRFGGRQPSPHVPENVLWSYIVQIASAMKAIHQARLSVRTLTPNKVIITSKNRIRLNGCGILDVVQFDNALPPQDLQQEDFVQLGRLILSIAGNANATLNMNKAVDHLTRTYTPKLKDCVTWLLTTDGGTEKNIDAFLQGIATEMTATLDSELHASDTLTQTLHSELENGRLVRLVAKMGLVNERPEYEHNPQWAETGERYYLKLFRDYVFHAVDEQGRPVTDLSHIIGCLNKLDAGSEEKVLLTSRDAQSVFVVSYREVKKGVEAAFNELTRGARRT